MLYVLKKSTPRAQFRLSKRTGRVLSATFLLVGLALLGQVIIPIASSYLLLLPDYSNEIVSPLASTFRPITPVLSPKAAKATSQESLPVSTNDYDPYRPSTWFIGDNSTVAAGLTAVHSYTISIPKLKIKEAVVQIGGDDLKKTLIAWPTSALPGSYGVNIIFGHSELPTLATPDNYSGIFTFIMDLEEGDEIILNSDGVTYRYLVFDKKVVEPANLSVLEQRFDKAYMTLITCVPPGTTWKRGVVKAELVP